MIPLKSIDNTIINCLHYLVVVKKVSQKKLELNDELYYKLNHMSHAIPGEWKSIPRKHHVAGTNNTLTIIQSKKSY